MQVKHQKIPTHVKDSGQRLPKTCVRVNIEGTADFESNIKEIHIHVKSVIMQDCIALKAKKKTYIRNPNRHTISRSEKAPIPIITPLTSYIF